MESVREQPFHREHATIFTDYEEFEDRTPQQVYEKRFVEEYLQHCRDKARRVISAATAETLAKTSGFVRKEFSRAELHVTNIRHIQHHAAHLSLRLQIDSSVDIPWISSSWHNV